MVVKGIQMKQLKNYMAFLLITFSLLLTSCTHSLENRNLVLKENKQISRVISSQTDEKYNLNVTVEIAHDIASGFSEEEIKSIVDYNIKITQGCLDESFKSAGSNIRVDVSLDQWNILDEEELQRIGYHPFDPDIDKSENLIVGDVGASTNNHIVRYFDASVNHASMLFDDKMMQLLKADDFQPILYVESFPKKKLLFLKEWGPELGLDKKNELEKMQAKNDSYEENIMASYDKILKSGLLKQEDITLANVVRMDRVEFNKSDTPWAKESAITFAHELMHTYGGLEDNYIDPENTAPNLMGAHGGGNSCVLTPVQVQKFIQYRKGRN